MDDPHDGWFPRWESKLHKMIGFATLYGSYKVLLIGDPCDDWSALVENNTTNSRGPCR